MNYFILHLSLADISTALFTLCPGVYHPVFSSLIHSELNTDTVIDDSYDSSECQR